MPRLRELTSSHVMRAALLILSLGLMTACHSDSAKLDEVREQQRQILERLTAIEKKLERGAARPPAAARAGAVDPKQTYTIPVGDSPAKGPADAPITIVEFSDYQCPYCARAEPLIREAVAAYPQQTRVVFKHYPLVSIHPQAMNAALAATAAGRQGKFWEMHEKLFANQRALAPEQVREYARQLNLDLARFDADLASDEVKNAVRQDIALAGRLGVRGTPTIFVNGRLLQNRSLDGFREIIDPALKAQPATPPPAG
ncbi:MAG: thioredoxin domain-containing protein [Deltaproteobacteria bacterium]|nr:thioredoxin domain-containing protein [Deltaproteobacteria bacterium]